MILGERYLEGEDIRFIEQFDEEKFVASAWGKSQIYVFDRERPELMHNFESNEPSKFNLSL